MHEHLVDAGPVQVLRQPAALQEQLRLSPNRQPAVTSLQTNMHVKFAAGCRVYQHDHRTETTYMPRMFRDILRIAESQRGCE